MELQGLLDMVQGRRTSGGGFDRALFENAMDSGEEIGEVEAGILDVGLGAPEGVVALASLVVREDDCWRAYPEVVHPFESFHSVHSGHGEVHDHQIRILDAGESDSLAPILGFDYLVAGGLKGFPALPTEHDFVFGYQYFRHDCLDILR